MGGKQWSVEEEMVFWTKIAPQADPNAGSTERKRNWGPLTAEMTKEMALARPGQPAIRTYTHNGCCKWLSPSPGQHTYWAED